MVHGGGGGFLTRPLNTTRKIMADSSVSTDPRRGGGTGTELSRRHVLTRRLEANPGGGSVGFSLRTSQLVTGCMWKMGISRSTFLV